MQTSRLSVIAQAHLYLKVRWPHFVILTPPKFRCCTRGKMNKISRFC